MLRARALDIDLDFGDSLPALGCPPVAGVERDFFGAAIGNPALPGPFQRLEKGFSKILFWPLE